jgi:hypothetical protein
MVVVVGFGDDKFPYVGGQARSLCEVPPNGMVIYGDIYLAVFEVMRDDDVLPS